MDHFRKRDPWTSYLVINEMNQMALLSIFSYQVSIFYISTKNVLLQFFINIWGYDKLSLSVLMSSQAESLEVIKLGITRSSSITIYSANSIQKGRIQLAAIAFFFLFYLLQKSVSWYSIVLGKKAWTDLPLNILLTELRYSQPLFSLK